MSLIEKYLYNVYFFLLQKKLNHPRDYFSKLEDLPSGLVLDLFYKLNSSFSFATFL
jgi:hypothetical protein